MSPARRQSHLSGSTLSSRAESGPVCPQPLAYHSSCKVQVKCILSHKGLPNFQSWHGALPAMFSPGSLSPLSVLYHSAWYTVCVLGTARDGGVTAEVMANILESGHCHSLGRVEWKAGRTWDFGGQKSHISSVSNTTHLQIFRWEKFCLESIILGLCYLHTTLGIISESFTTSLCFSSTYTTSLCI